MATALNIILLNLVLKGATIILVMLHSWKVILYTIQKNTYIMIAILYLEYDSYIMECLKTEQDRTDNK